MAFKEYPCVGYTPGYPGLTLPGMWTHSLRLISHSFCCSLFGSLSLTALPGPRPVSPLFPRERGLPRHFTPGLPQGASQPGWAKSGALCASCPPRAGWAWCPVSSLGVLPASSFGCFPHHCSAFLPLLRLCALPSGSPLLGLSGNPTASASCFHLLGCRNLGFLWCFSVSLRGMGVRPRSFFLQGPFQTSSTTPSTETSLPWRCCLLPLVVAMSSDLLLTYFSFLTALLSLSPFPSWQP